MLKFLIIQLDKKSNMSFTFIDYYVVSLQTRYLKFFLLINF